MSDLSAYSLDLIGYGGNPPDPRWPGRARIAVEFVVNHHEGSERSILHGDSESEASSRTCGAPSPGRGCGTWTRFYV